MKVPDEVVIIANELAAIVVKLTVKLDTAVVLPTVGVEVNCAVKLGAGV